MALVTALRLLSRHNIPSRLCQHPPKRAKGLIDALDAANLDLFVGGNLRGSIRANGLGSQRSFGPLDLRGLVTPAGVLAG